jgi:5'-deoxynucleotidase YfbR-like HD superfamily hydrolase
VRFTFFVWTLFFCLFSLPSFAQKVNSGPPQPPRTDITSPAADEDEARARIASEMAKKAAKERVAALKNDTDKLLRLSVELKQSVDKSDENVLSVDVIKKAEEIEKLARSVKEKMKGPN